MWPNRTAAWIDLGLKIRVATLIDIDFGKNGWGNDPDRLFEKTSNGIHFFFFFLSRVATLITPFSENTSESVFFPNPRVLRSRIDHDVQKHDTF